MTTRLTTKMGSVNGDDIFVRGHNLLDVLDRYDFTEILYLVLVGSLPDLNAKRMMNILLVSAVDHGITPGAIAARLTLLGAPEGLQGSACRRAPRRRNAVRWRHRADCDAPW